MERARLPEPHGFRLRGRSASETANVGLSNGRDRRPVAVVVTADGRRVNLPTQTGGLVDVSLLGIIRSILLGLDGLIGLITGSRRDNGGTRRTER